ncbi:MAG: hypothetical protein QJT81_11240 [Candidatus Thiothrix putei]|uniref:Protein-glutamine gamma-glutamyltransferase-like C-terminal domain-containing protein n=1 Tax=Candidatus Thiothrix putei TaxID=3080811 RepID=A0AA95HC58_9GAMM|nr:MAG: hypothetical protein QJT81_11240 [Candidatus Thiothrix putei]
MKLDNLTANIRLRSPWEAVDLGFALVRHHTRWIFPAWILLLGSFALIAWVVTPDAYKGYIPIALWWFKPLYDRVLLHILSHQMFNQHLSTAAVFSALPDLIRHTGLFSALTWRRFSLSRGFNLSIWQLEQLRGKARAERQALLHLQGHSQAIWLTIACLHLEYVVTASLYVLIIILDPTDGSWDYMLSAFTETLDTETQYWGNLLYLLLYTLTILVIEPLYVAASFSLYLNRRTQLEAWDIELAFRHLGKRLGQLARQPLTLLLASLLLAGLPTLLPVTSWANTTVSEYLASERLPPAEAATQISTVMQREELAGMRTQMQWIARNPEQEKSEDPAALAKSLQLLFANITKLLLWVAVIVLLVMALVYRQRILALLKPTKRKLPTSPPPNILFGMDIRPESLPDDIAAASKRLWEAGQHRDALSLLYRGALMRLTRHDHLGVKESHTEGDILNLAQSHLSNARLIWLRAATHAWQEIAYAHRTPNTAALELLWQGWSDFKEHG